MYWLLATNSLVLRDQNAFFCLFVVAEKRVWLPYHRPDFGERWLLKGATTVMYRLLVQILCCLLNKVCHQQSPLPKISEF